MLCSRLGDTWQIGTTSIREDHLIASGLRFVHWCHVSPNVDARNNPRNNPTVRVYQHLEDKLAKARADTDDILALTAAREGATNLRNYFSIAGKKTNAETAVKVAGATAKHCEKLRVATLHGRLPTSPGSLAHNRLSHTRPVRYETFLSNLRTLRKTSNAALAALRHSHPFLTLAKRIGLEPKHIP